MELVVIDADGACYMHSIITFLKQSEFQTLSLVGNSGLASVAMMCLNHLREPTFVMEMLMENSDMIFMKEVVVDGVDGAELLTLPPDEIQESIVCAAKALYDDFSGKRTEKERKKYIRTKLSSLWDSPLASFYFPTFVKLLNIEIVVWTLKTDAGDRLEMLEKFTPKNSCIATCNILWCTTYLNVAHYQLLKITTKNTRKVIDMVIL